MAKSKTYAMWICDTCENGISPRKETKSWKKKHKCCFCPTGTMTLQQVTFEITDKE